MNFLRERNSRVDAARTLTYGMRIVNRAQVSLEKAVLLKSICTGFWEQLNANGWGHVDGVLTG